MAPQGSGLFGISWPEGAQRVSQMLLTKFLQHQLQCQLCGRLKGGVQKILWLKNETIKGIFGNRQLCVFVSEDA